MTGREQLLTVAEVADWLHISRGWVHDHSTGRRKPLLPALKLGKVLRFREDDVNAFLQALKDGTR